MEKSRTKWQSNKIEELSFDSLRLLFENKIPAVGLSHFASARECHQLIEVIGEINTEFYENVDPPIERIGTTQFEFREKSKEEYFSRVIHAKKEQEGISEKTFDVVERFCENLQNVGYKVDVAEEEDFGEYFAGLVRCINNSARLHIDFAAHDALDWEIGKVRSQVAWNLYINQPDSGGECVVYNRQWYPNDERSKSLESYGYDTELVAGVEQLSFSPIQGQVVIFNCRNFHKVMPSVGRRLTVGSFVGRKNDESLVIWS